ncbi:MAG: hypothetical protein WEH44_06395, partial [Pirellulaceae bacterium]
TAIVVLSLFVLAPLYLANAEEPGQTAALDLFEQRIMPIFRSPNPSSCVQCHLASVDLKSYIRPSHEKTFVSLRDQGLIDLAEPEKSKILSLIQMGQQDLDRGAKLIHEKTRKAEYEAFAAWVKACSSDPKLRDLPPLGEQDLAKPAKPDEVIRHNRKDRLLDSFVRNVWSQRMRCFPCHTPFEIDDANSQHAKPRETHRQFEEQFGQRMNFFQKSPEATMRQLIVSSRKPSRGHLPLINVEQPAKSLLVLKPTSKVPAKDDSGNFAKPSSAEPVSHMGGLKMFVDDQSYKSFMAWIEDYARVVGDQYASADDLPADNWYPTRQVLRLSDIPEKWAETTGVQLFIHAWNEDESAWEPEPIAFTQGTVTPRRFVNGVLFLLASKDRPQGWDAGGASLPPGKYLVKAFVDAQRRLADDPTMLLSQEDLYGQAEIQARWRDGFQQAEVVSATLLRQ